jgi:hypothetical protein
MAMEMDELIARLRDTGLHSPALAADTIETLRVENETLRKALWAFLDAARYDPDMSGASRFMGWAQSELKRAEAKARKLLCPTEAKP